MNEETAVVPVNTSANAPVTLRDLQVQRRMILEAMKDVMKEGFHYGKIPGCGEKPTLLKPGAELLCMMFRIRKSYTINVQNFEGGHREITVTAHMRDMNDIPFDEGVGSCSTLESKYRWRNAERKCPICGKSAIIAAKNFKTGTQEGWLCWPKKDGCGAKFDMNDKQIVGQKQGRTENPDIADVYNTVLKIAKKRAHVDATLSATAASEIFTQDIEDFSDEMKNASFGSSQQQSAPTPAAQPAPAASAKPAKTSKVASPAPSATKKPDAPLPENLEDFWLYNLDAVGKHFSSPEAKKEIWAKVASKYSAKKSGSICYCPVPIPEFDAIENALAGQPAANDYSDDEIQMSEMKFEDVEEAA